MFFGVQQGKKITLKDSLVPMEKKIALAMSFYVTTIF